MRRKSLYIFALATILFAGCQKNEINPDYAGNNDIVKFTPAISGTGVLTKGQPASSEFEASLIAEDGAMSIPMTCETSEGIFLNGAASQSEVATKGELINEFGPGPQPFDTDETFVVKAWDAVTSANIIPGTAAGAYQEVAYSDSEWGTVSQDYPWNEGETKTFFAYSNLPASGASIANASIASQTLTYTVPSSASAQSDIIMGCCSGDGMTGTPAEMTGTASILFSHPLTAVQFKLGTIDGITSFAVNSISIEGVYASGTAEMTLTTAAGSDPKDRFIWTPTGSTAVSQTVGAQPSATGDQIGEAFLLIPQSFSGSSTALITINCTIDGKTADLYYPLTSGNWKAGYTNTYSIEYNNIPEGALSGMFSVGPGPDGIPDTGDEDKVYFSQGNLYYDGSLFKFEGNQYDKRTYPQYPNQGVAGTSCINGVYGKNTPAGHWGSFGWSTQATYFGMSTSENDADYTGDFVDWGKAYCSQEGLEEGLWRTLSIDEWEYLFSSGSNTNTTRSGKYKFVTICGIDNLILVPDICRNNYIFDGSKYAYSKDEWKVAEAAGLVCLPPTPYRFGTQVFHDDGKCVYWSSTGKDSEDAYAAYIYYYDCINFMKPSLGRSTGMFVRLVTDVK